MDQQRHARFQIDLHLRRIGRRAQCLILVCLMLLAVPLRAQQTCAIPGNDAPGTVTGIVNSYFPGTGSPAAGATTISVSAINAAGSATTISPGDLLLVMQMQGAEIDANDDIRYGDGVGTAGANANSDVFGGANYAGGFLNNANFTAGRYEFVVATSATAGSGSFTISAPLANGYVTGVRQNFQVIRVPQYPSVTIGAAGLTAAPWNGTSGGVVAIDVTGLLTLGNINVNGLGFRGGGVRNVAAQTAPQYAGYRNVIASNNGGAKGEGISGTPYRTYSVALGLSAIGATDGYPNGDLGRGAPGNAGGGGNQHNCGGGGGANGGAGGRGGACWNSNVLNTDGPLRGAHGGSPTGAVSNRIFLGGGGGAADVGGNTSTDPQGSGGAGGGIIIVRAGSTTGTGTFSANGTAAPDVGTTDAAGGGGAGGSIVVQIQSGSLAGITLSATGGRGGNTNMGTTNPEQDGPGGGGGGGAIFTNVAATGTVTPGIAGNITTQSVSPGDPPPPARYYARDGIAGITGTFTPPLAAGIRSGPECLPVLNVTKATTTPTIITATGAVATYSITVANTGGGARNVSVIDNALPPGWTLAGTPTYSYTPPGPLGAANLAAGAETSTGGPPLATFPLRTAPTVATAAPLTVPAGGANSLTWSTFFIPQNGSATINFNVSIPDTAPAGTYHNPAGVSFLDPTRTAANRIVVPLTNNASNRAGTSYGNTTYQSGPVTNVGGAHYSGLVAGPSGEDVTLLADLSISKTHTPATLVPGGAGSYSIVARNNGRAIRALTFAADQATDATAQAIGGNPISLTDNLPAGITLSGAPTSSNANWTCTGASGSTSFTCTQNNAAYPLAAQTNLTTVTAPINIPASACPGPVNNSATISNATIGETDTANNTGTDSAPLNCQANVGVTKTDGVTVVQSGANTTYTITVTNAGPAAADGALITDTASAGLNCASGTLTCVAAGGAQCPGTLSAATFVSSGLTIPRLPSGGSVTFQLTCNVTATGS